MKYNIKNEDGKMLFVFECNSHETIVYDLLDLVLKQQINGHTTIAKKEFTRPEKKNIPDKKKIVDSAREEKIAEYEARQFSIEFPEEQKTIQIENGPQHTTQINVGDEEKQNMDVDVLKILLRDNLQETKLEATKFVKSKTGLSLLEAKDYCDELLKRHMTKQ